MVDKEELQTTFSEDGTLRNIPIYLDWATFHKIDIIKKEFAKYGRKKTYSQILWTGFDEKAFKKEMDELKEIYNKKESEE